MLKAIRELLQGDRTPSDPSGRLYDWEKKALVRGKCPDCGGGLLQGPRGGIAVNVKCKECGNEFNIALLPDGAVMGHRLTKVA